MKNTLKRLICCVLLSSFILMSFSSCNSSEYLTYTCGTSFDPYVYFIKVNPRSLDIRSNGLSSEQAHLIQKIARFLGVHERNTNRRNESQFMFYMPFSEFIEELKKLNPEYEFVPYGADRVLIKFTEKDWTLIEIHNVYDKDNNVYTPNSDGYSLSPLHENGEVDQSGDLRELLEMDGIRKELFFTVLFAEITSNDPNSGRLRFPYPLHLLAGDSLTEGEFAYLNNICRDIDFRLSGTKEEFRAFYTPDRFLITDTEDGFILNGYADGMIAYGGPLQQPIRFTFSEKDAKEYVKVTLA